MSKFHKLKVTEVKNEIAEAVSVSFEVPNELKESFNYHPGQYTTLKLNINGEHVNRSYSFCSSPYMNEPLTIAVKRVAGGKGSNFINDTETASAISFFTSITFSLWNFDMVFYLSGQI